MDSFNLSLINQRCKLSTIMNFKLFKLRLQIFFYLLIGKIQKKIPEISLESSGHHSKKILLLFPFDKPTFKVAAFAFRKLGSESVGDTHYTFLIKDIYASLMKIYCCLRTYAHLLCYFGPRRFLCRAKISKIKNFFYSWVVKFR